MVRQQACKLYLLQTNQNTTSQITWSYHMVSNNQSKYNMSNHMISNNQSKYSICYWACREARAGNTVFWPTVSFMIDDGRKLSFISDRSMSMRVWGVLRGTTDLFIGFLFGGFGESSGIKQSSCLFLRSN